MNNEQHTCRFCNKILGYTFVDLGMSPLANSYIKKEDRARQRYMKHHFNSDINDPLQYDLVINTDHYTDEAVVQIILNSIAGKQTR